MVFVVYLLRTQNKTTMKKLYTLLSLCLIGMSVNAQITIREYVGGVPGAVVNGDTVEINEIGDHFDESFIIEFGSTNIVNVKINVKEISGNPCFTDQICGTLIPDPDFQGSCWNPSGTNFTTPSMDNVDPANQTVILNPKGNMTCGGCFHMRYTILINDVITDSVDVKVCTTLAVEEDVEVVTDMSVYPNPAVNQMTINTTGVDGNVELRITDVLGKVVYNETVGAIKKLDVSTFKNGVYLVTVLEKGKVIKTKRVVVKH
jgi:Secretion system C-terminal sorting domain